jgi:hypothetical protein
VALAAEVTDLNFFRNLLESCGKTHASYQGIALAMPQVACD